MDVSLVGVLVAGVISMALGFFWYSPLILGKPWMKLMGINPNNMDKSGMGKIYGVTFVGALVMAYVLSMFINFVGANNLVDGAVVGFWSWLGFTLPPALANSLYGKKPMSLLGIDSGYYLVLLIVNGAIIANWF